MKVLLYSHTFLPKIGGRELVVYHLARALEKLGHEARVIGPPLRRAASPNTGVRVHHYPRLIKGPLVDSASRVAGLREREMMVYLILEKIIRGADVIHAHTTYPTGYIAALAKRWMPRTPLVITPHGFDINVIPDFGMRLDPVLDAKIKRALGMADAITAISRGIEDSLEDAGADADKIHRIPNGTDLDRFSAAQSADARGVFGIPVDADIVLTVGNYHPRKGLENLARAMPVILQRQPRVKLVIVGAQTEALRPLIHELGLDGDVVLTGTLATPFDRANEAPHDLLAALYAECSIYVSASNHTGAEGLSLSLLDAMAAARPVVATRISGNEDMVESEQSGLLVDPQDPTALARSVIRLLSDPDRASRMGTAGRRKATQMSWLNVARQYEQVYAIAMDENRRARSGITAAGT